MPAISSKNAAALAPFDPVVRDWFAATVGTPTAVQSAAWKAIAADEHVLAIAPTGSGKTLAAFLYALNQLLTGTWPRGATRVLYISPLKALNNDIERNLVVPLEGLRAAFTNAGREVPDIAVRVRSGDTDQAERQRMIRRPPEILITTPESLNLLLSSPRARGILTGLQTVILDEIHAVAPGKRGTHLITAVERLVDLAGEFQRVALSATVRPPEVVAEFVGGLAQSGHGEHTLFTPRPVRIVDTPTEKRLDIAVRYIPRDRAAAGDETSWPRIADAVREHIARNRSTVVFTNSRRACERMALHINQDQPELLAYAHHGSLSKSVRRVVEERLKNGELKAIVATSSLELGIDIGAIDEAVLIQAPGNIAAALQRIGRAGHQVGAVSNATVFPTHGRDLLHAAVLAQTVQARDIEPIRPLECPLDVLAQVLVSMTGVQTWHVDDLYHAVRRSWPYRDLSRHAFDLVLAMLSGRYAETRIRSLQPLVSLDGTTGEVTGKPVGLRNLYGSGGTIPDRGYFKLRHNETSAQIGELDEEYVWERRLGDRFLLGSQSWRIARITHNDVFVTPVAPSPMDVPFWRAEELTRSGHLSNHLLAFLEEADQRCKSPEFPAWLASACPLDEAAGTELATYLRSQADHTKAPLPHARHVVVERIYEEQLDPDRVRIVIHTLWGGAMNRPFAMMLAAAWEERFGDQVQCIADNDCIAIGCPLHQAVDDVFGLVPASKRDAFLRARLEQTGFFGARFRECAGVALQFPKQQFDRRMPLWMSRERAKKLLEAVMGFEDFPILVETWRTCLQDEFDLDGLFQKLDAIQTGSIRITYSETTSPSPFAEDVSWQRTNALMYEDDSPLAGRPSALASSLIADVARNASLRPPIPRALTEAFEQKAQRLAPGYAPPSALELLDWLKERLILTQADWQRLLSACERDHWLQPSDPHDALGARVTRWETPDGRTFVAAAESLDRIRRCWESDEGDAARWLSEWLRFFGPLSLDSMSRLLPFPQSAIENAVRTLADDESVVVDALSDDGTATEVCDTENLEILLRWVRAASRPSVEPLPIEALPHFLATWQGLTQRIVAESLPNALEPLLLTPIAVERLETEFLPARVRDYTPAAFDALLAESGLRWYGCGKESVVLAFPDQRDLLAPSESHDTAGDPATLFPDIRARYTLEELSRGHTTTEVTEQLWKLAWAGAVANDTWLAVRNGVQRKFAPPEKVAAQGKRVSRGAFARWKSGQAFGGTWYVTPAIETGEDDLVEHERNRERVRILLGRYGVLFRELLTDELPPFRWGALFRTLRIMELAGEVAAGMFFEGVPGLQFAAPDVIHGLHADLDDNAIFWLNATDPASVCGLGLESLKGRLPKRIPSTHLVYHGRRLVLISEGNGKRLTLDPDVDAIAPYLDVFDALLTRPVQPIGRIYVETINGERAGASAHLDAFRNRFEVSVSAKNVAVYRRSR